MKQTQLPQRKHTRLDAELYADIHNICSITICVKDRRKVFLNELAAKNAVQVLRDHSNKTGVSVYVYCFMPEHVHLVLSPSKKCDIIIFVGQFKNLAQRAIWKTGFNGKIWQTSFWDHFLRKDEDVEKVVEYVLHNPVRQNIVEDWKEYPYSGSLVFDL